MPMASLIEAQAYGKPNGSMRLRTSIVHCHPKPIGQSRKDLGRVLTTLIGLDSINIIVSYQRPKEYH